MNTPLHPNLVLGPAPTLAAVDAALAAWRDRIAAASRNVAELTELPEYATLKAAARATPTGPAARVVATVDELWGGVLLLNEALGRAEAARAAAARLWLPAPLDAAVQVLNGRSVAVALGTAPVLHRRLLGGASDTAHVSPAELLATMEAAFDTVRAALARIATAAADGAALRTRLRADIDALAAENRPEAPALAAQLTACTATDPVAALDALDALRAQVDAATAAAAPARATRAQAAQALAAARTRLARIQALAGQAGTTTAQAASLVAGPATPGPDTADMAELPGWLDRLARTLDAGRTDAFTQGLRSWAALADRVTNVWQHRQDDATTRLAARDELRGRFGALQAKHRARHPAADPALDAAAAAARTALFGGPADLGAGRDALARYEAALARLPAPAP